MQKKVKRLLILIEHLEKREQQHQIQPKIPEHVACTAVKERVR